MEINSFLLFLGTILVLGYFYIKKRYSYWSDRGVPSIKPVFPFGNIAGVSSKISLGERSRDLYFELKKTKSVLGGVYFFIAPSAMILDLDLLRNIFVKDFQYFQNRGMYVNEKGDPLSAHLFSIAGEKWKNMRAKLTPTFTSGKMKLMHSTLLSVAAQFKEHLTPMAAEGREVEIKELLAQFTTDIIGNVAFGLELNSMKDHDNEFRKNGRKLFENSGPTFLKRIFAITFPKIALKFNVSFFDPEVTQFFMKSIKKTIDYREKNNVQRNDFLQLLMQIKDTGKLDGETVELGKLTFEELAAQTFIFFIAGFETSSSTMNFACYELALNQEMQDKARQEVQQVLQKHNGALSYEACMELTFLQQIIDETLRKYPIVALLRRECEETYKVPDTNYVIEKGTIVQIPVMGIHYDPEIYPEPEKFDPERFTKEAAGNRHPYAYLPFGKGPRDCIGLRFGLMQTRVGLATLLNNFRLSPSTKTLIPIKFQANMPLLSPDGGMYLKIEKL